tara:strand:+ start:5677 stop:6297 length:621 start_codon:yes stop_codon:yes gene_type:complete
MYVIGLTGGIASGKSTVGDYFRNKDVPVIDADLLGHRTYEPGTDTFQSVVAAFGDDVVSKDGTIDRASLGSKVFGNPSELKRLTDIVWPGIRRLASEELSNFEVAGSQIAVLEAAVLLEAQWQDMADQVWVTVVSEDSAIARLKERNGLDEDAARARIASQLTNSERIEAADVIVENNSSLEELNSLLEKLWVDLLERVTHRFTKE